jgi:hypothetical protein
MSHMTHTQGHTGDHDWYGRVMRGGVPERLSGVRRPKARRKQTNAINDSIDIILSKMARAINVRALATAAAAKALKRGSTNEDPSCPDVIVHARPSWNEGVARYRGTQQKSDRGDRRRQKEEDGRLIINHPSTIYRTTA